MQLNFVCQHFYHLDFRFFSEYSNCKSKTNKKTHNVYIEAKSPDAVLIISIGYISRKGQKKIGFWYFMPNCPSKAIYSTFYNCQFYK